MAGYPWGGFLGNILWSPLALWGLHILSVIKIHRSFFFLWRIIYTPWVFQNHFTMSFSISLHSLPSFFFPTLFYLPFMLIPTQKWQILGVLGFKHINKSTYCVARGWDRIAITADMLSCPHHACSSQELAKSKEVKFQWGRRRVGDGQKQKQAKSPQVKIAQNVWEAGVE